MKRAVGQGLAKVMGIIYLRIIVFIGLPVTKEHILNNKYQLNCFVVVSNQREKLPGCLLLFLSYHSPCCLLDQSALPTKGNHEQAHLSGCKQSSGLSHPPSRPPLPSHPPPKSIIRKLGQEGIILTKKMCITSFYFCLCKPLVPP